MSIDQVGVRYQLRDNPCSQYIVINAKDSFIAVLKEAIWKTTIFLNFCRKMRKLGLIIENKRYIRSHRGMSTKHTTFLAYLSQYEMHQEEKSWKNNDEALEKYQLSTPTPQNVTIRDTRELGLYLTFFQKQWGGVINGANVFISARCSWY